MIADAAAALLVLLIAITLSVYKPFGKTKFAMQGGSMGRKSGTASRSRYKLYILLALISLLLLMFVVLHLSGIRLHG